MKRVVKQRGSQWENGKSGNSKLSGFRSKSMGRNPHAVILASKLEVPTEEQFIPFLGLPLFIYIKCMTGTHPPCQCDLSLGGRLNSISLTLSLIPTPKTNKRGG